MKKSYDALPTTGYLNRITDCAGCDKDSAFISQAIDARGTCKRLVEYLTQKAREDSYPDANVVSMILTGEDYESFTLEVKGKS